MGPVDGGSAVPRALRQGRPPDRPRMAGAEFLTVIPPLDG